MTKTCSKCRVAFPLVDFSKKLASPDGLGYWCRVCRNAYADAYRREHLSAASEKSKRWADKNRDKARAANKAHRSKVAAEKAKQFGPFINAWTLRKMSADEKKSRVAAKNAAFYIANIESERQRARERRARGECDAQDAIRRARKTTTQVEKIVPSDVFEAFLWRCYLCGEAVPREHSRYDPLRPVLEHMIPLCRGGHHRLYNLKCAHSRCNMAKGRFTPPEYRLRCLLT